MSTLTNCPRFFIKNIIAKIILQNVKSISSVPNNASTVIHVQEQKVNVDGVNINYVKTGKGDHPVLLLPGTMGSIWTDFKPQIENLDKEKYTIIAWDPPGYGKSRPPDRTFSINFLRRDADSAYHLMKILGYNKFSLLGWSHGGTTSLILAAKYTKNIKKLVVTCSHTFITPEEIEFYRNSRDIDTWSDRMREPLMALYGEKYFQDTWDSWIGVMEEIYENEAGNICKEDLSKIKCPTLIVHGENDIVAHPEHPHFMKKNIKNSRVEIFKDGTHNLHLRYADKFNKLVSEFLDE